MSINMTVLCKSKVSQSFGVCFSSVVTCIDQSSIKKQLLRLKSVDWYTDLYWPSLKTVAKYDFNRENVGARQMKKEKLSTYTEAERPDLGNKKKQPKRPFSNNHSTLCVPDTAQSFGDTHIVRLKLVQADRGGQSEGAQEPVAQGIELGHTLGTEVIGDGGPDRKSEYA